MTSSGYYSKLYANKYFGMQILPPFKIYYTPEIKMFPELEALFVIFFRKKVSIKYGI
jgi:hypothetical protein